MEQIRNIAVLGMGALGSFLARQLQSADGVRLYGIVRDLETYWGSPIVVEGEPLRINYRSIETMPNTPMDLILLCVRSYDYEAAARLIRPLIGEETLIIPFTCGLHRPELLSSLHPGRHVIPAALPGALISRNGRYVTVSRRGSIWFGAAPSVQHEQITLLRDLFEACGIRFTLSGRMDAVLWKSFILDTLSAQTGLIFQLPFGKFVAHERARKVVREAQREIAAVAKACGTDVEAAALPSCEAYLSSLPADGHSRMLQDYWQNRRLETDALCDDLLALASAHGIATPACSWMKEQILEMTEKRSGLPVGEGQIRSLSSRQGMTVTPEIIASRMRIDILKGKYPPGAKLAENELASQFYASRSSVRTALQILMNEGLIRTLSNGRREVLPFSEKELRDLFDMRYQLEKMALDTLLKNRDTVYPKLAETMGKIEKKYRSQSVVEEAEDLDVQFHRSIILSADNMFLLNAWDSISRIWYATMYFTRQTRQGGSRLSELFGKHRHLYELILARDSAVFPELKRHISEGKENAAAVMAIEAPK